jgi:hypothetical protein
VTKEYLESFSSKLSQLGFPDMVKPQITGQVGEAFKQIVLSSGSKGDHNLSQILSGGEKRLIALADFLAEVSTNKRSQGIILDDPMTSLDSKWQEKVADLLIEESRTRQVIVFTHNLRFLGDLISSSEKKNLEEVSFSWIRRGSDDRPGYVENNSSPSTEEGQSSGQEVQKCIDELKSATLSPRETRRRLISGYNELRKSYESLVIFKILNKSVQRFVPIISVGRLKGAIKVMRQEGLVESIIEKYEFISEKGSHLESDEFNEGLPTLKDLEGELTTFRELKKQANSLLKE